MAKAKFARAVLKRDKQSVYTAARKKKIPHDWLSRAQDYFELQRLKKLEEELKKLR